MRATIMYKAGDVQGRERPDAAIDKPSDAVIRITRAWVQEVLSPSSQNMQLPSN
jgi:hypothetical protein